MKWKYIILQLAREKLEILDATPSLELLTKAVSNLHKLKDDRNDQWAFCQHKNNIESVSTAKKGNAYEVEIIDYRSKGNNILKTFCLISSENLPSKKKIEEKEINNFAKIESNIIGHVETIFTIFRELP